MDATRQGFRCNWAGCPKEFDSERNWLKHVAVHVFTLKPNERTPWLGPPEVDPDNRSDCEDEEEREFSQINALSSSASTPPQVELPDSADLAEKINGPSTSTITAAQPFLLLCPDIIEHPLSKVCLCRRCGGLSHTNITIAFHPRLSRYKLEPELKESPPFTRPLFLFAGRLKTAVGPPSEFNQGKAVLSSSLPSSRGDLSGSLVDIYQEH